MAAGSNASWVRCRIMLRFSHVLLLMLLGLPAAAQQGRNDYPNILPHDWTLLPPKSNEWRAVSPRRLAFSLRDSNNGVCVVSSSAMGSKRRGSSYLPEAGRRMDRCFWIHS